MKTKKMLKFAGKLGMTLFLLNAVSKIELERQTAVAAAHNLEQMFTVLAKHSSEESIAAFTEEMVSEAQFVDIAKNLESDLEAGSSTTED